jgi:hypothetical protein
MSEINTKTEIERPTIVEDEHLEYLDDLRESGATNMFGAAPWLKREFSLSPAEARAVLSYWIHTFSERNK